MSSSRTPNGGRYADRHSDMRPNGTSNGDPGDLLNGVGSASSLGSSATSVFSSSLPPNGINGKSVLWNSTPLTSSESSPPKIFSPLPTGTPGKSRLNGVTHPDLAPISSRPQSTNATPLPSPPRDRKSARPPPGEIKGYRAVWDPELDGKLGKEEKRKMKPKLKQFGSETYEPDPPPDPRLAIVGYTLGNCVPKGATGKGRLRFSPYSIKPYLFDAKTSIGPGPPKQVVVTSFDPFTPDSQLKTFFSAFGDVAEVHNQTDPNTASFLGVCLIKFRDSRPPRGNAVPAAAAAKKAEKEANGERIGLRTIRVERDREGRKCKRYVEQALKKARQEEEAERAKVASTLPKESTRTVSEAPPSTESPAPPPNAPKGPASQSAAKAPPEGPRNASTPQKSGPALLIEEEPVLTKIKRKPYIFIPDSSVPVLGTTIPHMKRRLKAFHWKEIRLDKGGYYVIFDDSKRGEDETVRCFNESNGSALFTYTMEMECQQYGNPDYERSPSPERVLIEKRQKEEIERLQKEEDEDVEIEKKHRAEDLDPVQGALAQLQNELRAKIMDDIKIRVAIPTLYECLDPTRHAAKRRKLGLSDAIDTENKAPSVLLNKASETPPGTPRARRPLSHSRPLRPHDRNSQRRGFTSTNAYIDERRRNRPAPRVAPSRPLHFRLQDMFGGDDEDDSDDERRTTVTRDTDDVESRPMSRASSVPFETDSAETPKSTKKRKADRIWDMEDEQEVFDPLHKSLLGHLLQKRPEDLATRELEQVVNTLPRQSKFQQRARTELFYRQRAKFDDELFKVKAEGTPTHASTPVPEVATPIISFPDVDTMSIDSKELPIKTEKPKKKRKTKKELLLERQELERQAKEAVEAAVVDEPVTEQLEEKAREVIEDEEEIEEDYIDPELGSKVEWGASTDKPRRTVEDEDNLVMDIDGWQHIVKDAEDFALLTKAMAGEEVAPILDVKLWAWKQKDIKALNNGGVIGPVNSALAIPGYYVPNLSGCARTEGVKKIFESEKSKYLPHRLKVQRAREEREALAKKDPAGVVEAAKQAAAAKLASTATSRTARANNRRLVNDINLQKQNAPATGMETDAFRFNQLKKRKKLVKFDRSAIHGWGLYAEENITANDMIIEYVGEKIRQKVADMREIRYTKQGMGSSYLFRMVEDEIVDATKKGGIARFINHSCTPNCTAKIIKVEGTRRIVIYALKDISKNEELTYDYKFEREYESNDRIPCLCGSVGCKGFLN
ncbi:histone H3-K4 methyltransferase Set1 [Myriangium duriaei CBS 260.36]|uniref:Histone-lysine N-methyltransferase, H3 lysine-4 specific n=1 Tax=Myriangium duriaei CBS 260.36 TaxID=1168546 RepID=A0A9P4MEC4_9PEZI|nr:histone H3-K4 methyltransferase Set1 [Myriangium duriaei CBS 260.36]